MEKRFVWFIVLTAALFGLQLWLFPPQDPAKVPPAADSVAAAPAAPGAPAAGLAAQPAEAAAPAQTVVVRSPLYEYRFSTRGAALTGATLNRYASYVVPNGRVQLVPEGVTDVLAKRVVVGRDTLDLRGASFTASAPSLTLAAGGQPQSLTFRYAGAGGVGAEVTYTFRPDDYLVDVKGRLTGIPGRATLLTELPPGLAHHDAPEHGSARELSLVGYSDGDIETWLLRKVKGNDSLPGPLGWAGVKDRYFLMALIAAEGAPFSRVELRDVRDYATWQRDGDDSVRVELPRVRATAVLPLGDDNAFALKAYLGPQEHERLVAVGHELSEVNPYGYLWMRPIIRPIASAVLWVFNHLHVGLGLSYGWVLIVFGVLMRVVTWPLNSKAMRLQQKNMEVQPKLQARMKEIQEQYADDPEKQRVAIMEMYKEMGVNPLSMFSGCVPMLIPMPVLITLFFVFQSAIEFRGASFWWLPDLSLADPLYILPVFLMASQFGLMYISTRMSGMDENPQATMMMYMMPLLMGFLFFNFASGLNLYYATTNVASLPQQLLIARERRYHAATRKAAERAEKSKQGHPGARRVKRKRS